MRVCSTGVCSCTGSMAAERRDGINGCLLREYPGEGGGDGFV